MTVNRVWMALLLGAAIWGCEKNTGASTPAQQPLAGLRYFDAVLDTGYMDFRVVDIVRFAPNAVRAVFRSGGNPEGTSNGFLSPPFEPMRSAYLSLAVDSIEEAERVYALLIEGGQVFMPMAETFFAHRFAMLRDKFGTSWMLLNEKPMPQG